MKIYTTNSGIQFRTQSQSIPDKKGQPIVWHDAWVVICPKETELETLDYSWSLVHELADWLIRHTTEPNFRIIVGWDKSIREHQGQIFKIFEPKSELTFIKEASTYSDYIVTRSKPHILFKGWQREVFQKE